MKNKQAAQQKSSVVACLAKLKPYKPLLVMVSLVLFASVAIAFSKNLAWMPLFMGLFLLVFSMLKLFDVKGFAKSFAMYDILAKRAAFYAKSYPFIELALALAYLAAPDLHPVNIITAIIMAVGLVGIIKAKASKLEVKCACMGSFIDVPVGYVTIIENTTMLLMAVLMIFH